jgi:phage head maturation protease
MEKQTAIFHALGAIKENQIEVTASTTGTMLRIGCVFAPGAFGKAALSGFVNDGAILVGHDWDDLPIGMPVSAKIENNELVSIAQFHTTEDGQDARTIAKERMDAGKTVSVSIGFMPDYSTLAYFNSGADMLKALEEAGEDLTQYDVKAIKAWKYSCSLIRTVAELYEWSIVLVGANQRAKARRVQSFNGDPAHGLDLETHLEFSLAGIQRAFDVAKLREQNGRRLSKDREAVIRQIHDVAASLLAVPEEPKAEEKDEPVTNAKTNELAARALFHRANVALMKDKC